MKHNGIELNFCILFVFDSRELKNPTLMAQDAENSEDVPFLRMSNVDQQLKRIGFRKLTCLYKNFNNFYQCLRAGKMLPVGNC